MRKRPYVGQENVPIQHYSSCQTSNESIHNVDEKSWTCLLVKQVRNLFQQCLFSCQCEQQREDSFSNKTWQQSRQAKTKGRRRQVELISYVRALAGEKQPVWELDSVARTTGQQPTHICGRKHTFRRYTEIQITHFVYHFTGKLWFGTLSTSR